jgi:hypothetical protein
MWEIAMSLDMNNEKYGWSGDAIPARVPSCADMGPLEIERYWAYVEALDMTDEQRIEFLQTVWRMMVTFVDLGFGIDLVQQLVPALVQATLASDAELHTRHNFNDAAQAKGDQDD